MQTQRIRLSNHLKSLPDNQIQNMVEIVVNYLPNAELVEEIIRNHMKQAKTIRLALNEDRIVGFSVASNHKRMTPFYHRPVNVVCQRMLFLDPDFLYSGIGLQLLSITMRDLLGRLWPLKRVVTFCRTQNPVVAKFMSMFNEVYPQYNQPTPRDVREFAASLLPLLGDKSIDDNLKIIGALERFRGLDYTDKWDQYYHRRKDKYEKLMLNSAFEERGGRIINSGHAILMIGYAKPFNFIRFI